MRMARRTYDGAFHHGMNRGYEGRQIFRDDLDRNKFLEILEKVQHVTRIRILAYCLIDNHYHFVLQNTSGKMSEFFKQLNGQYARYFRKRYGGKGYVFQDRYKSKLIQDDAYLMISIAYVLNNPVNTHLTDYYYNYTWSSAKYYYKESDCTSIDIDYVEDLFGNEHHFIDFVSSNPYDELPTVRTELGEIIGGEHAFTYLEEHAERRSRPQSVERRRIDDAYHEPVEKVFQEFEKKNHIKVDQLNVHTHVHKKLRGELLVYLKEHSGLTYREISQLDLFSDLSMNSLGTLYTRNRKRVFSWKK